MPTRSDANADVEPGLYVPGLSELRYGLRTRAPHGRLLEETRAPHAQESRLGPDPAQLLARAATLENARSEITQKRTNYPLENEIHLCYNWLPF